MKDIIINIAQDFNRRPVGRSRKNSSHSGEAFRDDILLPKLQEVIEINDGSKILVDFTGTTMQGSSFLEEAFGGILRNYNFTADILKKYLTIVSPRRPAIEQTIWQYIEEQQSRNKKGILNF
ncbi:MAG: DUF4325 domain-containing protein [Moraxellaceae bacterium]|nr:MAG: DUF4325 domain-containing protein [Moraxellaceae bacterium]